MFNLPGFRNAVRRPAVIAVVLALCALAFIATRAVVGPVVDAYRVDRTDIVQTIVASGRVETPLRVNIGSQLTGAVAAVPVDEGQVVKQGQVLIVLDENEARAAVAQAKAAVAQADTRLRQLREVSLPVARQGLRQAQINLDNARRQYERARELQSRGYVGMSQLDDARQKVDVSVSQLSTAELQVAANSPGGSEEQMARAAREQAAANLRMAEARLDYMTIESPADGTLISRAVERGDVVQPGKTLMVLSPAGRIQLVVQIDEKNLAWMRIGQTAIASADAFPDKRLQARLVYINPAVDPQRGSVEVKLDVPDAPEYLRQDMTVSVDIEVARREGAIAAPTRLINDIGGNAPWVMKAVGNQARRQPVKLGVRGKQLVEVVDGLSEGDLLIPVKADNIVDGEHVRARPMPRETQEAGGGP